LEVYNFQERTSHAGTARQFSNCAVFKRVTASQQATDSDFNDVFPRCRRHQWNECECAYRNSTSLEIFDIRENAENPADIGRIVE
jgi:hypothetical protein